MWALLSDRAFTPQVMRGDAGVSIWLPEFEVYGEGDTYAEAKSELLDDVRAYVAEYLEHAEEYRRAPNRAGHLAHVVKAFVAEARGELEQTIVPGPPDLATLRARVAATTRRAALPVPDEKDLRRSCELDGWEETEATSPDQHRYRKRLPDGSVLRTKVSRGRGPVVRNPGLWTNIWRHQLGLESEDEFWEVLRTGGPAPRGAAPAEPPELQMEAWLFEALV